MADTVDVAEFWLPSEFLSEEDTLRDKENFNKNGFNTELTPNISFPTEFPIDFECFCSGFGLDSPVESLVGSTETESDEEDLRMSELTRVTRQLTRSTLHETQKIAVNQQRFEKPWILSVSPQSTLNLSGSCQSGWSTPLSNVPSQVSSPPTTPFDVNGDAWELIYAAAGQVAKSKINAVGPPKGWGPLVPPRPLAPVHQTSAPLRKPFSGLDSYQRLSRNVTQNTHLQGSRQELMKQHSFSAWVKQGKQGFNSQQPLYQIRGPIDPSRYAGNGACNNRRMGLAQSACPLQFRSKPHQNHQPHNGDSGTMAVFMGGSDGGVKRECAGTGVFLPRRYTNTPEPRKKPGYGSAQIPPRVVRALNKNLHQTAAHGGGRLPQPRVTGTFIPDYDALMERRWPEGGFNNEVRLPQEWTY